MPHSGPSAVQIVLSEDERAELVRRAGLPERWRVDRARIILACAEGMSNAGAAQALGVAVKSVSKWRRQFASPLAAMEQNSRNASSLSRISSKIVLAESIPGLLRSAVASAPEAIGHRGERPSPGSCDCAGQQPRPPGKGRRPRPA